MKKTIKVELSKEQETTLKMWVGAGKTEQRLALRAQVILYASEGLSLKAIEEKTGLNWQSCLKWRKRFMAIGLDGLKDEARSGHPLEITPEERVHIMALACTSPDDGSTRWSIRKLADACGVSKSRVCTGCWGKVSTPK